MKKLSAFLVLAICMLQFACSGGGGGGAAPNSRGSNTLFLAVKNTTPTFQATVSAAPKMKSGLASSPTFTDPAMGLAFSLLRDYSFPADEGKVDMTNIYKVLFEAGGNLDNAKSLCSPITSTIDSAISSYAFSDFLGHTYDCGGARAAVEEEYGNSVAYREDGSDRFMLTSYKWAPDWTEQIAIGVIETSFNSDTKEVELTFAQTVRYPAGSVMGGTNGSGGSTRTYIKGNSETHAFELKIALAGGSGGTSIVGKGISQGAGNYFLMRNGADYYCLPAGATETDLMNITPTNQTDANTGACSIYVTDVAALNPYTVGDPAQIPNFDLSSFDLGVAGTPFKYLMFML